MELFLIGKTEGFSEADLEQASVELIDGEGKSLPLLAKAKEIQRFSFRVAFQLPSDASHVPESDFHLRVKVGDATVTKPIRLIFAKP